jgi:fibronectin-binding autotransporter adhesin
MKLLFRVLAGTLLLAAMASPLFAGVTATWTDSTSDENFNNVNNWSPLRTGAADDILTVNTTGADAPVLNADGGTVAWLNVGLAGTASAAVSPGTLTIGDSGFLMGTGGTATSNKVIVGHNTTAGTSSLLLSGGSLTCGVLHAGGMNSSGLVKLTGDAAVTLNASGSGFLVIGGAVATGTDAALDCYGSSGTLTVGETAGDNPNFSFGGTWARFGNARSTAEINVNYGSFGSTTNNTASGFVIGSKGGTATFNQNGGTSTASITCLGSAATFNSVVYNPKSTLNLNGGNLRTKQLRLGGAENTNVTGFDSTVNFNGATVTALADAPKFISLGTGTPAAFNAYVLAGGAILDTNTFAVTISSPLQHFGTGVTDGGLTKVGDGTLTLDSAASTYLGDTTVNGGTLNLVSTASLLLDINPTGDYSQILGTGAVVLDGMLNLNVADVTGTSGSWTIVDTGNLTETFGATFGLKLAGAAEAFSGSGGMLSYGDGARTWTFNEASGVLSVAAVPEPSSLAMLAAGLFGLLAYAWKKR